jgi:succinyl-CoA synthetase alpha subunit
MAIFVDKDTNVLIQGITGRLATVQTRIMLDYKTKIVAGVTPGKGGQTKFDIPVYDSVQQAASKHRIDASVIYVPAPFVQDAAFEAIDAGIRFMVIVTDWVPLHSEIKIKAYAEYKGTRYIGPNTMGLMAPGQTSLGGVLATGVKPGGIAVVCRSGALSNEIPSRLAEQGIKLSVVIGLGGDPVVGSRMLDVLKLLKEDEQTKGVLLVGEIGGIMEEEAAEYVKAHFNKQVVAFIAGRTAPRGKAMGHAGAMIMSGRGTAESKIKAFQLAGVPVAKTLLEIPSLVKQMT